MDKTGTPSPAKRATKAPSVSPVSPGADDTEETLKKGKGKPKSKKTATPAKKRKVQEVDEDEETVNSEVESDN